MEHRGGEILSFEETFQRLLGARLPVSIPRPYTVLETLKVGDSLGEGLIGSELARKERMLNQGDLAKLPTLPEGFFLAGLHHQSPRSLSFFWCEVDSRRRVFFRFPTVATPLDGERGRARMLSFMESYRRLFAGEFGETPRRLIAHDSMGDARYRLELEDGRSVEHHESLLQTGELESLLRRAQRS